MASQRSPKYSWSRDICRVCPHGVAAGTGRWQTEATLGSELSSLVGRINKASLGIPLFSLNCADRTAPILCNLDTLHWLKTLGRLCL